jgi:hypothetical protein
LGGIIHVSGMGMPRRIMAQYDVCFSMAWMAHGLLNTYRPSMITAFLIHSRLVPYQWVRRSTTRS